MKKRRTLLIFLVSAIFLTGLFMTVRQQLEYQRIVDDSVEAAQIAGLPRPDHFVSTEPDPGEPDAPPEEPPEQPEEPLPEEAADLLRLNLEALQAVNGDVVGWISIPNTQLSYPLVQGRDNQYYLTHSWRKKSSGGGSVFLESTNRRDLSDFHTIAYAHRMRNDTMFGTLKYYREQDFWRAHPSVYIVAGGSVYRYDIFSAEEASVKGIVYRLDLVASHLEEDFIRYCLDSSVYETGIVPESGDRFLTLSTCTGDGHATRWVVHAVLARIYDRDTCP